jgi:hypothetical protein
LPVAPRLFWDKQPWSWRPPWPACPLQHSRSVHYRPLISPPDCCRWVYFHCCGYSVGTQRHSPLGPCCVAVGASGPAAVGACVPNTYLPFSPPLPSTLVPFFPPHKPSNHNTPRPTNPATIVTTASATDFAIVRRLDPRLAQKRRLSSPAPRATTFRVRYACTKALLVEQLHITPAHVLPRDVLAIKHPAPFRLRVQCYRRTPLFNSSPTGSSCDTRSSRGRPASSAETIAAITTQAKHSARHTPFRPIRTICRRITDHCLYFAYPASYLDNRFFIAFAWSCDIAAAAAAAPIATVLASDNIAIHAPTALRSPAISTALDGCRN